ncbi:MAG: 16S rRNA (guanine(527)-N(7))-methyltransferase RsmG [Coriobacteriia bacterium]|nr:16S rRNA (guanine(527)-N(7))-methyltransferase RsmG [Coriobacteriia bacterium]
MKHTDMQNLLITQAELMGVGVSRSEAEKQIQFLCWLASRNESISLTAISEPGQAVTLHTVDALSAVPELEAVAPGAILDLGTGGGVPGIPLAIHTSRSTVLLDSIKKKVGVLNNYLDEARISAVAIAERAEDHAATHRANYAAVVARAVAGLPSLVELAAPLLRPSGHLICYKGDPLDAEIVAGRRAAEMCGMQEVSIRKLELPDSAGRRSVITYSRIGEGHIKLPRAVGKAQKRPLA